MQAAEDTSGPYTCIIQPRIGLLTETFIEAHYRDIRFPVFRLECEPFPTHTQNGRPLVYLGHPVVHRIVFKLLGFNAHRSDLALAHRLPGSNTRYGFA